MKFTLAFATIAVAMLLIEESSHNDFQENKSSASKNGVGLWYQGKVPYEISQKFGESLLIFLLNHTHNSLIPKYFF